MTGSSTGLKIKVDAIEVTSFRLAEKPCRAQRRNWWAYVHFSACSIDIRSKEVDLMVFQETVVRFRASQRIRYECRRDREKRSWVGLSFVGIHHLNSGSAGLDSPGYCFMSFTRNPTWLTMELTSVPAMGLPLSTITRTLGRVYRRGSGPILSAVAPHRYPPRSGAGRSVLC